MQLREIDARLGMIARILNATGEAHSVTEGAAPAPASAASERSAPAKRRRRQRWFDDGEAVRLMKRLARSPMPTAEIVKLLTHAKGHDQAPAAARKKFQAAAYMAVANAVKAGQAKRFKDGRISLG